MSYVSLMSSTSRTRGEVSIQAPVLVARGLSVSFRDPRNSGEWAEALSDFDLSVSRGESLAIVGESGCGKSIAASSLAGLIPSAARLTAGHIEFDGERISGAAEPVWRRLRGRRIAMVFQDPMSALNPVVTIGGQLVEAVRAHQRITVAQARDAARVMLEKVKLPDPQKLLECYPHQLSGGMLQRVMIAIAICNNPDVLLADEPTTALDASVQHEILELLRSLQRDMSMALVLITHDLGVVAQWSDRVIVMYAGRKVEEGKTAELLRHPLHPYTRALIDSRPRRRPLRGVREPLMEIPGTVPALGTIGPGCAFADRCRQALHICRTVRPSVQRVARTDVLAACHVVAAEMKNSEESL